MERGITLRHFHYALAAFLVAYLGGAIAFWIALDDSPLDALYRSTVTISLTGLDNRPDSVDGEVVTIMLIFAGMAIYAYIAGALVEIVARGVLTGSWSERRKQGKRSTSSSTTSSSAATAASAAVPPRSSAASGEPFVVLDVNPKALDVARERGVLYLEGSGTVDDDLGRAAGSTAPAA